MWTLFSISGLGGLEVFRVWGLSFRFFLGGGGGWEFRVQDVRFRSLRIQGLRLSVSGFRSSGNSVLGV